MACSRCLLTSRRPAHFHRQSCTSTGNIEELSKIGNAAVRMRRSIWSTSPQVSATTTSDASGNFRFLSLAPGTCRSAEGTGFKRAEATVTLQTNQTLNVPIALEVGTRTDGDGQRTSPLVNIAETRNQLTLEDEALSSLPVPGRNYVGLVVQAPGVSGLGTMGGGQPGVAGTPGSASDNYSTETPSTRARTVRARWPTSSSSTGSTSRAASGRVC